MKIELSVIIPTYNRGKIFNQTLASLCLALKNIESEIIVVNDYKSKELVIENQTKEVIVINNPLQGAASARNLGFSISKGDLILFLDDDMLISKSVIINLMDFTKSNHNKILSPNWIYPISISNQLNETKFGRFLVSIEYNSLKGWIKSNENWDGEEYIKTKGIASYCLMIKRQNFIELGGYNQTFLFAGAEDYDLTKRLEKMGIEFYIAPKQMIFHNENDRIELRDWLKRKRKNGYTLRNAVEIGYSEMAIEYSKLKRIALTLLWKFKTILFIIAEGIPNKKNFDPLYYFLVKLLTSIYIYAGYQVDYKGELNRITK